MKKFLTLILALSVNASAYLMGTNDCKIGSGTDPILCAILTTTSLPTLIVAADGSALHGQEAADHLYNEATGRIPALNLEKTADLNKISVEDLKFRIIRAYDAKQQ